MNDEIQDHECLRARRVVGRTTTKPGNVSWKINMTMCRMQGLSAQKQCSRSSPNEKQTSFDFVQLHLQVLSYSSSNSLQLIP